MFNYDSVELKPGGEDEEVNLDNVEDYVELVTDFCLSTGIHKQMEALRSTKLELLAFCRQANPISPQQKTKFLVNKWERIGLFSGGFNKVFPLEKLFPFSPDELQLILCGEQVPQWTREDVINYTEPKLGFTRER